MKFLLLSNAFFNPSDDPRDKTNWMGKIGTEGFTLYSYLLLKQADNECCEVSMKMILNCFSKDAKEYNLNYYDNKKHLVSKMKDKRTIAKYLDYLESTRLIEYIGFDSAQDTNINTFMTIKVRRKKADTGNFTMVSQELFMDYIHKIGHVGWSLYCILYRLHNTNFGSSTSEGFANPSQSYLSNVLHLSERTISAYAQLLEDVKLIKIEHSKPICKGLDIHGHAIYEYIPNNYIVKARTVDGKYYIQPNDK